MTRTNPSKPTTLLVHGATIIGERLASILSTQKSSIIVLDEFTKNNKSIIKKLKADQHVDAYDFTAIPTLSAQISRLDYIFILLDQYLECRKDISSKKFMSETNTLDALFKLAIEQGAKVILTTSIALHRKIASDGRTKLESLKDAAKTSEFNSLELQRYCENLAAEYHDQSLLDIRIARIGEVLGEGIPLETEGIYIQMIKDAITKPRITIPGEGLDYVYYIHYLDAVYGIIKALFSNKTNGEVFSLSYPDEISSLNLAYKILELNPTAAEIAFAETADNGFTQHSYIPAKNLSTLGWSPRIPFEQALLETMNYFYNEYNVTWDNKPSMTSSPREDVERKKAKAHRADTITSFGRFVHALTLPFRSVGQWFRSTSEAFRNKTFTPRSILKPISILIGIVVVYIFFIGPLIQVLAGGGCMYYYGKNAYRQAYDFDMTSTENSLQHTSYCAALASSGWGRLGWMSVIPGMKPYHEEISKLTAASEHLTTGAYNLALGGKPYIDYARNFQPNLSFNTTSGGGSREYSEELQEMEASFPYIETASVEMSLAKEYLESLDTSTFPRSLAARLDDLVNKVSEAEYAVQTLDSLARHIPELLGKDERKTYIILFQNPMELRSTGGWLTSACIVGVENGQVRQLDVRDVYEIDGQITEEIEPPETMQSALGVGEWTLSLSNWYADFPQSADAAEYFLKLSDNIVEAEGVIAVDLEAARQLIDIWGAINVPGETEPVTKDNLYDMVIEIHRQFTPGSTQKPVFLSNLANELVQQILASPRDQWPEIGKSIKESLSNKHILLDIHNTEIQKTFDDNGWSGHLVSGRNTIAPVEWNWGANKANHYLDRSYTLTVDISDENSVSQTIDVHFQNKSTTTTYPEGDYINFERMYVPAGSMVTRAEGLRNLSIRRDIASGLDEISGWITVPSQGTGTFSITYTLDPKNEDTFPISTEGIETVIYTSTFIKQPGTGPDPLTIQISYPAAWSPKDTVTGVHRELNSLIQQTDLATDSTLTLTWER